MRKAINTGIITGLILTVILILGTLCRIYKPADTTVANLTFTIIFVSTIAITLWIAMEQYSKSTSPNWSSLSLISIITSLTTAVLFSTASFIYTRYFSSVFLSDLMEKASQNWLQRSYSEQSIAGQGEWTWY